MKKKYFILSFFFLLVLFVFNYANAEIYFAPENPTVVDSMVDIDCDGGNSVFVYVNNNLHNYDIILSDVCPFLFETGEPGQYNFVECLAESDCGVSLDDDRNSSFFVSERIFYIENNGGNGGAILGIENGIFYGRDIETGTSTASDLVAMVGNASGITLETMGGIVGTIGGIIFAFGFILYIRFIINESNIEKKRKERGL